MSEKRKYPRIRCQFFTELCDEDSTIGVGEIFDISDGGAGLESHTPFVVGQKTLIKFMLDGELIVLAAEIVRVEGRLRRKFYGVKFVGMLPETTEKVDAFVKKPSQA
ncbi:MAG: PilZ domain-containing protein [Endomicrobiia bacterium]|nr:PilZ domain-containing protein [Endomicrobiia bacterium]